MIHWNTTRSAYIKLSRFVTPKFGFAFCFPQKYPSGHSFLAPQIYSSSKLVPSSILTHRCFKTPDNNYVPAIAKTKKNDNNTIMVSFNNGKDANTAVTNTYKPLIDVIALNGLKTLKALNEFKDKPPSSAFSTVFSIFYPPFWYTETRS